MVPVFLLESVAFSFVPVVGRPLSFLLFCWIYAYYSFEWVTDACSGNCDGGAR